MYNSKFCGFREGFLRSPFNLGSCRIELGDTEGGNEETLQTSEISGLTSLRQDGACVSYWRNLECLEFRE